MANNKTLIRFLVAGSVDVGKSTLVGRLLHDAGGIYLDQFEALKRASPAGDIDFSLLTDGLGSEREQKITIDVAYRYFTYGGKKYIIADVPGHEQYTRNMVTGASQSACAVIVIDAARGLDSQSRRHLRILSLMRLFPIIVAVNKMDTVHYRADVFLALKQEIYALFSEEERSQVYYLPVCATSGGMLAQKNEALAGLSEVTLLELLNTLSLHEEERSGSVMHIQSVVKDEQGVRWYLGSVAGMVSEGDRVTVYPSGIETSIKSIIQDFKQVPYASDAPIACSLASFIDAGRGDVIASAHAPCRIENRFNAILFWLDANPCIEQNSYHIRIGTKMSRCVIETIMGVKDIESLNDTPADSLALNDIGSVRIQAIEPMILTGERAQFVLLDEYTNQTVGGGFVSISV